MPRKLLRRYMPDHKTIKEHKYLQCFGTLLHNPALWHLNRHSVAKAFLVGLVCAFIPVPFQMVIASGGAILVHANLPLSVVLVWLTNPVTIPPMFYGAYVVGAWVMNTPQKDFEFELSLEWLGSELSLIWQPFLLGCAVVGITAGLLGYLGINLLWRWMVLRKWRRRHLGNQH
ncbi:hypothetical protein MMIC_P1302 [Mariprofundus micogutta]|uniref:DUF2062 domain-containing protein n=1 Tax=Mariprofundus micogutta TaxID=1921010 RepID=A0A1L8CN53_9PROT|nr:DUF2062 domain-containing protein [Mariprofundus micogutta]GAV20337.1 hypothetical protein MMIC_P1302 [Mariprofundus micogutta]